MSEEILKMITERLCSITPTFTELEIKRHLQETVRNQKLAKKSVRDRYRLEKFLEEAQADEEANANELEMTAKEM